MEENDKEIDWEEVFRKADQDVENEVKLDLDLDNESVTATFKIPLGK